MTQNISSFQRKLTAQSVMAFLLLVFGMAVVLCSLYLPPRGEIHPSVITVFGMILAAAGAFMGIDLNFQLKRFVEIARDQNKTKSESPVLKNESI